MEGKRSLIEIRLTFKSKRIDLVIKNKVGGKWKGLKYTQKTISEQYQMWFVL